MHGVLRELFADIPWSTSDVLAATRAKCTLHGRTVIDLPVSWDVDDGADLERLRREIHAVASLSPRTAALLRTLPDVGVRA